jgi:hypothetical protein
MQCGTDSRTPEVQQYRNTAVRVPVVEKPLVAVDVLVKYPEKEGMD